MNAEKILEISLYFLLEADLIIPYGLRANELT